MPVALGFGCSPHLAVHWARQHESCMEVRQWREWYTHIADRSREMDLGRCCWYWKDRESTLVEANCTVEYRRVHSQVTTECSA
jgi:hypothetical protein